MVSVIIGALLLAIPAGIASWLAVRLRREGLSALAALRWFGTRPYVHADVFLIARGVSRPLGELVIRLYLVAAAVLVVWLLPRIIRRIRNIPGAVRRIRNPAAWRGEA